MALQQIISNSFFKVLFLLSFIFCSQFSLGQITGELTVIGDAQIVYIDDVSSAKVVLTDGVYTLNKGIVQQKSVKPKIEKGRTEESKSEKIAVQKVKKQSKESKLIASRKIVPKECDLY